MDIKSSRTINTNCIISTNKMSTQEVSTNALSSTVVEEQLLEEIIANYNFNNKNERPSNGEISRSDKKQFYVSTGTQSGLQYNTKSLIGQEHRNYSTEENSVTSNYSTLQSDSKLLACKSLMRNIYTRSIHKEMHQNIEFTTYTATDSNNVQIDPVGRVDTSVQSGNSLKKVSMNEHQHLSHETECAEKTTYCRPVLNIFSHEFVHKTMERNARLHLLVKKLVQAREKEKKTEAWNNYINELKNKHGHYYQPSILPKSVASEDEKLHIINHCSGTRAPLKFSNFCACEIPPQDKIHSSYKNLDNNYCFPTSEQGRLMILNRETPSNGSFWEHHPTGSYYRRSSNLTEKDYRPSTRYDSKMTKQRTPFEGENLNNRQAKCMANQAESECQECLKRTKANLKSKSGKVLNDLEDMRQQYKGDEKHTTLSSLETKLDLLLFSVNAFIGELRAKKMYMSNTGTAISYSRVDKPNKVKSDTFGLVSNKKIICGHSQEIHGNNLSYAACPSKREDALSDILYEEMNKSQKVKKDIDEILNNNNRSCGVQIPIDIPTKDQEVIVEEIKSAENGHVTIAVNTDPLGLLALFRVSADTVKHILSCVPYMDYSAYLTRLQVCGAQASGVSRYVCNICGLSFCSPSQLSDHIHGHNLSNLRNCRVCRKVLQKSDRRASLFACLHCGRLFTRAYCRELHEQACGYRRGRRPEVSPGRMLLS